MHGTDYNFVLTGNAAWKTGAQGGLDFPSETDGASSSPIIYLLAYPSDGSFLIVYSRASATAPSTFGFENSNGTGSGLRADRNGEFKSDGNGVSDFILENAGAATRSPLNTRNAMAISLEADGPVIDRLTAYLNGSNYPNSQGPYYSNNQTISYWGWNTFHGFIGTIQGLFRWNRTLTNQELIDISTNPDSLFIAA